MLAPLSRAAALAVALTCLLANPLRAEDDSAPPPPRAYRYRTSESPPVAYPAPVVRPDPPLSPAMKVLYAPFYATGLVLRYGLYYGLVAPLEVFSRAVTYGVEGGVEEKER